MPAPCSQDFRIKALAAVKRGKQKAAVSRMLKISRNTFRRSIAMLKIGCISVLLLSVPILDRPEDQSQLE